MEALSTHSRRPLTVEAVLALVEQGFFDTGEPCELLWGELHTVTPQGYPHLCATTLLRRALSQRLPGLVLHEEKPLVAGEFSLPEPDLALMAYAWEEMPERVPHADEALLVIELAVSSHRRDRAKAELYARAGVPRYWLVDIPNRFIEVYSRPLPDGRYAHVDIHPWESPVELPRDGGALSLAELLGPSGG